MVDVIGNTLEVDDVVMVALGAKNNQNNSGLTPCRIIEIKGNRCKIQSDPLIMHNNKRPGISFSYACKRFNRNTNRFEYEFAEWKFSHQVVKVFDYITKH